MPRTPRPSPAALALVAFVAVGCSAQTTTPQKVEPAPVAAAPDAPAPETKTDAKAEAKAPPPLTEEDLALIAADPKDLTPEMRRKRAYARRRQIMQNPDSPTARALNDLVEAHQAGEIDVNGGKGEGTWFHAPGTKPTSGRPPAGWRPSDGQQGTKPAASEAQAQP